MYFLFYPKHEYDARMSTTAQGRRNAEHPKAIRAALRDEIADQAHDQYGLDSLLEMASI